MLIAIPAQPANKTLLCFETLNWIFEGSAWPSPSSSPRLLMPQDRSRQPEVGRQGCFLGRQFSPI